MEDDGTILDLDKVNEVIARCSDVARDSGCNMYEAYKAFEALHEVSKQMVFGPTGDGRDM